jgi:hypothetical protein
MLASFYTDFKEDEVIINRVHFQYNPTNKTLMYNGVTLDTMMDDFNVTFLNIPQLKETLKIIDYHRLDIIYKYGIKETLLQDPRKKPPYYDLRFNIYFSPHKYDDIIESLNLLFKTYDIEAVQHSHGYYVVYKGERIGLKIFLADDDTGYIIELDYTDRKYTIFREFEHHMKEGLPDLS